MSDFIFSPIENVFCPVALKKNYEIAGTWPNDAISISNDVYDEYKGLPPEGKIRGVDDYGMPAWVDKPPLTKNELIHLADEEKQRLISYASNVINFNMWQTKLLLGRITDDEKTKLNLWLDYIDAVNAIDTSTAPDIQWPTPPAE